MQPGDVERLRLPNAPTPSQLVAPSPEAPLLYERGRSVALPFVGGISRKQRCMLVLRQLDIAHPTAHRGARNVEESADLLHRSPLLATDPTCLSSLHRFPDRQHSAGPDRTEA